MNLIEQQNNKLKIERTKIKIFTLLTQCIQDIDNVVTASGLTMRDVGIDIDKYITVNNSYLIELSLQMWSQ